MQMSWMGRTAPGGLLRSMLAFALCAAAPQMSYAHTDGGESVIRNSHGPATPASLRPYDGLESARATWAYRRSVPARENQAAQTLIRRSTTASTADGRFGNVEYQTIEGKTFPGDEFATYFVFGEGRSLWCAYAEGSRYTETTLPAVRDVLDPAPQFGLAPWARVGAWLDAFEQRGIMPTHSPAGQRYEVAGAGRSGTFAIELGSRQELVAVELGLGDSRLRWEYSDFHIVDGRPIPRRLRDYTITVRDGVESASGEGLATLESFDANTSESANAVRFDPQHLNVRYFNEATGEVFSPDRSQKLFTIHDDGISGGGLWSRRTWLLGVVAVVSASLWLVWRKLHRDQ